MIDLNIVQISYDSHFKIENIKHNIQITREHETKILINGKIILKHDVQIIFQNHLNNNNHNTWITQKTAAIPKLIQKYIKNASKTIQAFFSFQANLNDHLMKSQNNNFQLSSNNSGFFIFVKLKYKIYFLYLYCI